MINVNDIVAIGGVLVGVIGGIFGLTPYLKKKNINVYKALNTTEQVLTATEPLIKISEIVPVLKPAGSLLDWIEQKAKAGVKAAEQLYHSGILKTDEDRFKTAQNTVYAALKEINVEPTMNQKKLISDFIHEAVNDLGHAIPTETEKNAQIQKVQQDLDEIQKENKQLKQKLAAIQNTETPVQKTNTAAEDNASSNTVQ